MSDLSIMNTYGKLPVAFESGDGSWLYDTDGNKYFDTFMGIAVCGLGHSNAGVVTAIKDQASRLIHCSNLYHSPLQLKLAQELCKLSNMDKAFFCNSGAEANEAAIKIARKFGHLKGIQNPSIIVMEHAFHGRTLATLSASGNRKFQAGFEPLLKGFVRAPFNDIDAIKNIIANNPDVVAVMLEPIQGEAGVLVADEQYLVDLRKLCTDHNILMICDEVQSGTGRTGKYFAFQHSDIVPDVVTTAKALGNGYPIAACLASGEAANSLAPGSHGSTFGGNPLGCAAALAVIAEIESKDLVRRAEQLGEHIINELKDALMHADYVKDVRGKGLMIGIEMTEPCFALVPLAKAKGILLNVTQDNVIRLLPSLNLSDEEAEFLIDALIQIIRLYAADDRAKPRN